MTGQENFGSSSAAAGVSSTELEALKQEILSEMRREIQQAKAEIIEGKDKRMRKMQYIIVYEIRFMPL